MATPRAISAQNRSSHPPVHGVPTTTHLIDASTPLQPAIIPATQPVRPPKAPERIHKQPCSLTPFHALSRLPPPTPHLSLVDSRAPPPASLTTPPRRSFRQRIELSYTALVSPNRTVEESAMAGNSDFEWHDWSDFLNDDAIHGFDAQANELGMHGYSPL